MLVGNDIAHADLVHLDFFPDLKIYMSQGPGVHLRFPAFIVNSGH